jgi:hypothetical protein
MRGALFVISARVEFDTPIYIGAYYKRTEFPFFTVYNDAALKRTARRNKKKARTEARA